MAEGTPLERVQVVNSGARVQIPPSPLVVNSFQELTTKEYFVFSPSKSALQINSMNLDK